MHRLINNKHGYCIEKLRILPFLIMSPLTYMLRMTLVLCLLLFIYLNGNIAIVIDRTLLNVLIFNIFACDF